MLKPVVLLIAWTVVPVLLLPENHVERKRDAIFEAGRMSHPDEQQTVSGDNGMHIVRFHEKSPQDRQKRYIRYVGKGIKFFYTVSKTGVKWLWVKTKNGFRRLGRALDFLDRWYILGPMLYLEPEEIKEEYYHYEEYDEDALAAEGVKS